MALPRSGWQAAFFSRAYASSQLTTHVSSGILHFMKTTVDIADDQLRDVMRFTKAKTRSAAIATALADYNRRRRMAELTKLSGTCNDLVTFDELMASREIDLPKSARRHSK